MKSYTKISIVISVEIVILAVLNLAIKIFINADFNSLCIIIAQVCLLIIQMIDIILQIYEEGVKNDK